MFRSFFLSLSFCFSFSLLFFLATPFPLSLTSLFHSLAFSLPILSIASSYPLYLPLTPPLSLSPPSPPPSVFNPVEAREEGGAWSGGFGIKSDNATDLRFLLCAYFSQQYHCHLHRDTVRHRETVNRHREKLLWFYHNIMNMGSFGSYICYKRTHYIEVWMYTFAKVYIRFPTWTVVVTGWQFLSWKVNAIKRWHI